MNINTINYEMLVDCFDCRTSIKMQMDFKMTLENDACLTKQRYIGMQSHQLR